MNKSLIALAVLGAFTSTTFAQSSVTLYGRLDENVIVQDPGKRAAASTGGKLGKSVTKLQDAGVAGKGGSRIGFKGQEDLGDGLAAIFLLEAAVSVDTGAAGAPTTLTPAPGSSFFNRQSWVGLKHSGYGELRFGRVESLSRENNVKFNDVTAEGEINIVENLGAAANAANPVNQALRPLFQNFGTRVDNAATYKSPIFGGIQLSAIIGLGERQKSTSSVTAGVVTTTTDQKASEYRGVGITYAAGPIAGGLSYEELNGGSANGAYNKAITLGGSYDFGIARLHAAYQTTDDAGGQLAPTVTVVNSTTGITTVTPFVKGLDHEAWNLGVSVPYGNFRFAAQYTGSTIDRAAAGGGDFDQDKYGVSATYAFSKRTALYAALTERGGNFKESFARKNEYLVGLAHTF